MAEQRRSGPIWTWEHPWISSSGRPWSLRVRSDLCAKCGHTPDVHPPVRRDILTPAERHAANVILDRPYADPDDDAAVITRAVLRLALRDTEGEMT